jgi:hypothetical protein
VSKKEENLKKQSQLQEKSAGLQEKIARLRQEIASNEEYLSKLQFAYQPFIKHPDVAYFEKKLLTPVSNNIVIENMNPEKALQRFFKFLIGTKDPTSLDRILFVAGSGPLKNMVSKLKERLEKEINQTETMILVARKSLNQLQKQTEVYSSLSNNQRLFSSKHSENFKKDANMGNDINMRKNSDNQISEISDKESTASVEITSTTIPAA